MVDRARIFGSEAAAYDDLRPGYPDDVIDMIVADGPELIVDVGCGTGIAARLVADRGASVLGVEPDADMAAVALEHGLDVTVSSFEDWQPVPCDVMYAAQSWHWIDPVAGAHVAARSIRPDGRWIGIWNVESDDRVDEACRSVFTDVAPELLRDRVALHLDAPGFHERIDQAFTATGHFAPATRTDVEWHEEIEPTRFVDRLGTHSAHRLLPERRRREVRGALVDAFGPGGTMTVRYRTEVLTTVRR